MKPLIPVEDRNYLIYLVTNLINGKLYVGQTCRTWKRRWDLHCWKAENNKDGNYFANAIKKHGLENFFMEEITTVKGRAEANKLETFFIRWYDTMDRTRGYNCTSGGDGGFLFSDESREKLSISQKALERKMTPENKEALIKRNLGSKRPPEFGKHLSKILRKSPTEEVHRLYLEEKLTTYEVAEKLGITQSTVWHILDFDGVIKRPNKGETLPQFRKDLAQNQNLSRLYLEEKLSTVKLGKMFDVSSGTILRHLRDMGVPIRKKSESISESTTQNFDINNLNIKKFSVVDKNYILLRGKKFWRCLCECGYEQYYSTNQLKKGKVSNCKWHKNNPVPLLSSDAQTGHLPV